MASFREQMKVYQSYWSDDPEFDSSQHESGFAAILPCPVDRRGNDAAADRFAIEANFGWPRERRRTSTYEVGRDWARRLDRVRAGRRNPAGYAYVSLQVSGSGWWPVASGDRAGQAGRAGRGLRGVRPTCYLTSTTFAGSDPRRLVAGRLDQQWATCRRRQLGASRRTGAAVSRLAARDDDRRTGEVTIL